MTTIERARLYLSRIPGAISGAGGHTTTYKAAVALVHGFDLPADSALDLLREWNSTCQPPWSESDLRHKVKSANQSKGSKPRGYLLDGNTSKPAECSTGNNSPEERRKSWPTFETPTDSELRTLANLRNLSVEGLRLAVARELLWFADYKGSRCWIVSDSSRRAAQARRLDGKLFKTRDGEAKSLTLPGSVCSFPIGSPLLADCPHILFVEGGPDLLGGFHFISCEGREADCTAVCMLGANHGIAESALPLFVGKAVRLFPHLDDSGRMAAIKWARSLLRVAKVDVFNLENLRKMDGKAVQDLNDLSSIHADDFESNRELWSLCPE